MLRCLEQRRCPPLCAYGVAHQTSLRSDATMMTVRTPSREAGCLLIVPVTPCGRPHLHTGIRIHASPCRRWRQCATAELVVIDLIAQQDPQSDAELARYGDARLAESFLLQLPLIESAEGGIAPDRVHRGFAPQKAQQRVATATWPSERQLPDRTVGGLQLIVPSAVRRA